MVVRNPCQRGHIVAKSLRGGNMRDAYGDGIVVDSAHHVLQVY